MDDVEIPGNEDYLTVAHCGAEQLRIRFSAGHNSSQLELRQQPQAA
jgi:hypothetical protein